MLGNEDLDALLRAAAGTRPDGLTIESPAVSADATARADGAIAIIGISARVGAAGSARALWDAVNSGTDLIRPFPADRFADADELALSALGSALADPVPYAYLDDVDRFDPSRYGISRTEAELMDPHQRLFLAACVDAIEDAGYGGVALRGSKTGVYAASGLVPGLYLSGHEARDAAEAGLGTSGGIASVVASRISHMLDLTGPAMIIDTACSSSMTALITACQDLRAGRVTTAIAGAVRLTLVPPTHKERSFGIEAASHRTRTFSSDAEGTGGGEGTIAFLLKPLARAQRDRDHVYGVVKGFAANQDGATTGITAPSASAQAAVVRAAWRDAGIDPGTVGYVEAHGTATKLGDPVEIDGLVEAFSSWTDARQTCAVGSAKSNVGHLDSAAGVTGVLKVLGMFADQVIPPTLHFVAPNTEIDFIDSPVFVADTLRPWASSGPRRAGVSSFGMSGTNTHVLLEEPPVLPERAVDAGPTCVTVSAQSSPALRRALTDLLGALDDQPDLALVDVARTLNTGRAVLHHRAALVVRSVDQLRAHIRLLLAGTVPTGAFLGERGTRPVQDTTPSDAEGPLDEQAARAMRSVAGGDRDDGLVKLAALFVAGADVDLAPLDTAGTARLVPLPGVVGQPTRVWRPTTGSGPGASRHGAGASRHGAGSGPHPLVHRHQFNGPGVDVFESDFSASRTFELGEHVVDGSHVMVGTGFLEMAYSTARRFLGDAVRIDNMHYLDPLVTHGDEVRRVQLVMNHRPDEASIDFLVRSFDVATDVWAEHARGVLTALDTSRRPERVDVSGLLADYRRADGPIVYRRDLVQTAGRYWNAAQSTHFSDDARILLHFEADAPTRAAKRDYALFPPIMDSSLNLALLNEVDAFLPLALGHGEIYGPQPDAGYSWMVPEVRDELADTSVRTSRVVMCDEAGNVFARFENYTVGRLTDRSRFQRPDDGASPFHTITWRETVARHETPAARHGITVIGGPEDQDLLREAAGAIGAAHAVVPADASDADVEAVADEIEAVGTTDVVHLLAGPGHPAEARLHGLFRLLRALHRRPWTAGLRYRLLTRGAHSVVDGETVDPAAHAADAMVVALVGEHTRLTLGVLDIAADGRADVVHSGVERALADLPRARSALRDGRLFESTIAAAQRDDVPVPAGAVLVTGGTGGMGTAIARRLVRDDPDRTVVLVGRRSPAEVADRFAELPAEERDRILVLRADVLDPAQTAAAIAVARSQRGGLAGVVHAAGLPGDGFIMSKDDATFAAVLEPKVRGTDVLLAALADDPPAFVLLCSSMTAVFGAVGQSDYAAANAYLDGTALRGGATRIVALDWTGWAESGMAHERGIEGGGFRTAFVDDETGAGLAVAAIGSRSARLLVGSFDPEVVAREHDELERVVDVALVSARAPRGVTPAARIVSGRAGLRSLEEIVVRGVDENAISDVERVVIEAWATALGVDELDVDQAFFDAGGNSLLASRLQVILDERFPGVLSIVELFVYDTVAKLAAYITEQTVPAADRRDGVHRSSAPSRTPAAPLAQLLDEFLEGKRSIEDVLSE